MGRADLLAHLFKSDCSGAPEELTEWLSLSNTDFNRPQVEAQTAVELDVKFEITTNQGWPRGK